MPTPTVGARRSGSLRQVRATTPPAAATARSATLLVSEQGDDEDREEEVDPASAGKQATRVVRSWTAAATVSFLPSRCCSRSIEEPFDLRLSTGLVANSCVGACGVSIRVASVAYTDAAGHTRQILASSRNVRRQPSQSPGGPLWWARPTGDGRRGLERRAFRGHPLWRSARHGVRTETSTTAPTRRIEDTPMAPRPNQTSATADVEDS